MGHRRSGWCILVGLLGARNQCGGEFANDYTVPGSESKEGLDAPRQGLHFGQRLLAARSSSTPESARARIDKQSNAVTKSMKDVGKLDHVVRPSDPLADGSPAVSKNGTIAYGSVSWDVVPASLERRYLDQLNKAVEPARTPASRSSTAAGPARSASRPTTLIVRDHRSGIALLLLLLMFHSLVAAVCR